MNRVIISLSRVLFQSLNMLNISPSDQYNVAMMEAGGFDSMMLTLSYFSNMRWDEQQNICYWDIVLLIDHMRDWSNMDLGYFFSFTKHEDGMLVNSFLHP